MATLAAGMGVAQLLVYLGGLVWKIKRAADLAQQNKLECDKLATRCLSLASDILPNLPPDKELAQPLAQLGSTLEEAHNMVVACQKRGAVKQFFRGRRYADQFKEVNGTINSDINFFFMAGYIAITRRLDSGTPSPQGSSSSRPAAVETQKVVSHVSSVLDDNPRKLTWAEIAAATDNLAVVLGGGRSGTVYKGRLHHHGRVREVAVKVLKKHGRLAMEDAFVAELEILYPLRHDHIVRLVGWCEEAERRVFVYEHMSNGTLRDHLLGVRGSGGSPVASSWKARLEVLLGASRAIQNLHLHRRVTPPVIHRNVSSSNILLDASWKSHLSDFGHALFQAACEEHGGHGQLVTEAIGTFGYLDPEYYHTTRVSLASDVYSFGVVMLEVLTGRPPVSGSEGRSSEVPVTLVSSVLSDIQNDKLRGVLDGRPALVPTPQQLEALELVANTAVLCLWPHGKDRPAMSDVVAYLERALEIISS